MLTWQGLGGEGGEGEGRGGRVRSGVTKKNKEEEEEMIRTGGERWSKAFTVSDLVEVGEEEEE